MARPHPLLIELVGGRPLIDEVDLAVVSSAVEHRVAGVLATALERTPSPDSVAASRLEQADIAAWARNRAVAEAMVGIAARAAELSIDVAFIKGVTTEARWYERAGERPTWDVDLVLAPWHRRQAADLVAALQPTHSLLPHIDSIVRDDRVQSIDLGFGGIPVDLHLDPLKMELAETRHPEALWARLEKVLIEGTEVPVFDPTVSLLLAAFSLNKDRFRYLIGYADIVRMASDPGVDHALCQQLAKAEGLLTPLQATLHAVKTDLGLSLEPPGSQNRVWNRLWGPQVRLLGAEARVRFRYRQTLLPLFTWGRWPEVAASWKRRVFPTRALLDRIYPDVRGPYLVRIFTARVIRRSQRRRQRQALRSSG